MARETDRRRKNIRDQWILMAGHSSRSSPPGSNHRRALGSEQSTRAQAVNKMVKHGIIPWVNGLMGITTTNTLSSVRYSFRWILIFFLFTVKTAQISSSTGIYHLSHGKDMSRLFLTIVHYVSPMIFFFWKKILRKLEVCKCRLQFEFRLVS